MRILTTYREAVEPQQQLTEAQILALCCEVVPVDPCSEVGRVSVYEGADAEHRNFDEQEALAAARAANPSIRILSVRAEGIGPPPGMPCGKKHESWEGRNNCCEDVEPLAWDMDVTPDVLPAGGSIIIAWEGGTGGETTVTTSSNATWFDDGRKSATGYGYSIELLAGPTFCGATAVTVSDGCSEATVMIRSDQGQWVNRGPVCALAGHLAPVIAVNSGWDSDIVVGKYRQVEVVKFEKLEQPSGGGGCGGGAIPDCFECVGRTVTCPDGQAWRSTLPSSSHTKPCLSYGVDGWSACRNGPCMSGGVPSWQSQFQYDCGDNDIAMYGTYLVTSGGSCSLSLGNEYRFLTQTSLTLYEWTC